MVRRTKSDQQVGHTPNLYIIYDTINITRCVVRVMIRHVSIVASILFLVVFPVNSQISVLSTDVSKSNEPLGHVLSDGHVNNHSHSNDSIDFGFIVSGKIGDLVWNDTNVDGIQDEDEKGISSVDIWLYNSTTNSLVDNVTTNETGYYIFEGLSGGKYTVKAKDPLDLSDDTRKWYSTDVRNGSNIEVDSDPQSGTIVTLCGSKYVNLTIDFGYFPCP